MISGIVIDKLSRLGFDEQKRTIERDMNYLLGIYSVACDDEKRPYQWWWNGKDSIDIPGMGRNSALTFKLAEEYLKPLLPGKSLSYLQPKFRQSRRILAAKGREKERKWVKKIRVIPRTLKQIPAKVQAHIQNAVYEALYEENMLEITYHSRSKNETTIRRISPLGLIYRGITTELIFCEEKNSTVKRFILHRIKKAKILDESLAIPDGFNLDQFIKEQMGFPGSCKEIQFKAWLSKHAKANVEETPLNKFQTLENTKDGGVIVKATVRDTADLTSWILGLGARIKVLEPEFLREKIAEIAKNMAAHY
jgi:predicted DNA-binding transcriptional regulator YafY